MSATPHHRHPVDWMFVKYALTRRIVHGKFRGVQMMCGEESTKPHTQKGFIMTVRCQASITEKLVLLKTPENHVISLCNCCTVSPSPKKVFVKRYLELPISHLRNKTSGAQEGAGKNTDLLSPSKDNISPASKDHKDLTHNKTKGAKTHSLANACQTTSPRPPRKIGIIYRRVG